MSLILWIIIPVHSTNRLTPLFENILKFIVSVKAHLVQEKWKRYYSVFFDFSRDILFLSSSHLRLLKPGAFFNHSTSLRTVLSLYRQGCLNRENSLINGYLRLKLTIYSESRLAFRLFPLLFELTLWNKNDTNCKI